MTNLISELEGQGLRISGIVAPSADDNLPDWATAIALISPREPEFWSHFCGSPEWHDGQNDPVDRWSKRVLDEIAAQNDGVAYFPFGGAPFYPFYSWAIRSGAFCASPIAFLADGTAGLFTSFRGAIALRDAPEVELAPPPCSSCEAKPCVAACPASALTVEGYDVAACHGYLSGKDGADCLNRGCRVRRACPVGTPNRPPEQSAYFMSEFHK